MRVAQKAGTRMVEAVEAAVSPTGTPTGSSNMLPGLLRRQQLEAWDMGSTATALERGIIPPEVMRQPLITNITRYDRSVV